MSLPPLARAITKLCSFSLFSQMFREHDVEQFEDDLLEFIRLDLSISASGSGTDLATWRQAAANVLHRGYTNSITLPKSRIATHDAHD
jgi:hypothetical protein